MVKELLAAFVVGKIIGEERRHQLDLLARKYISLLAAGIFTLQAIFYSVVLVFDYQIIVSNQTIPWWFSFTMIVVNWFFAFYLWKMYHD